MLSFLFQFSFLLELVDTLLAVVIYIPFVMRSVRDVIEYLRYGQTIMLQQTPSTLHMAGLMM